MPKFNLHNIYNEAVTSQELHTEYDIQAIVHRAQNPSGRGTESRGLSWMNVAISCSWQVFAVLWGCYTLAETSTAA